MRSSGTQPEDATDPMGSRTTLRVSVPKIEEDVLHELDAVGTEPHALEHLPAPHLARGMLTLLTPQQGLRGLHGGPRGAHSLQGIRGKGRLLEREGAGLL